MNCINLINCDKASVEGCSYVGGASIPTMITLDSTSGNMSIINNSGDATGVLITNNSTAVTNNISGNRKHGIEGVESLNTLFIHNKDNAGWDSSVFGD